jgi:uncharacterized RDD family membrane protein YckC
METEQPNPYFSDIEKEMRNIESRLASGGKRFANSLIDMIFFYFLVFIVSLALAFAGGLSEADLDGIGFNLLFLVFYLLYFTLFELYTGKTIGKFITKTHVVTEEGEKLDFKTAFVRSLCRIIPFDAFSYLGGKAVGWHDTISKTRVINDEV